ncbi:hypothetical protein KEJ36_03650 [Candidatus Bathyarchaeota archaeon]|nr:hypothetical protein [Candidatus Bathyarchaeota archaeon]
MIGYLGYGSSIAWTQTLIAITVTALFSALILVGLYYILTGSSKSTSRECAR